MMIMEVAFGSTLYQSMKRLRDRELRRPLGLVLEAQEMLGEDRQFHFAAIEADEMVLGTLLLQPLYPELAKLRAMAVASERQGEGIGRDLVRYAERFARDRAFGTIELSARISAKGFYEKLGYRATGTEFVVVGLPHIKMTKHL